MHSPDFFDLIPALTLRDPLADILGAASDGLIEYRYADAVRLAGHSCPTVAGAWLMTRHALTALYADAVPERGGVRVELRDPPDVNNAGVVGAVIGLLTGAAAEGGFQGLAGRYGRRGLLGYAAALGGDARFTRLDSGAAVVVAYRPHLVAPDPATPALMAKLLAGQASLAERMEFGRLWQDRVRRILFDNGATAGLLERVE